MILPPRVSAARRPGGRGDAHSPSLTSCILGAGGFLLAAGLLLFLAVAAVH